MKKRDRPRSRAARAALAACGGATGFTLSLLADPGRLAVTGLAEVVPLLLLVPDGGAGVDGSLTAGGGAAPAGAGVLRFDAGGTRGPTVPPAA